MLRLITLVAAAGGCSSSLPAEASAPPVGQAAEGTGHDRPHAEGHARLARAAAAEGALVAPCPSGRLACRRPDRRRSHRHVGRHHVPREGRRSHEGDLRSDARRIDRRACGADARRDRHPSCRTARRARARRSRGWPPAVPRWHHGFAAACRSTSSMNCSLNPSRGAVATTSSKVSRSKSCDAASRRRRPTCRRRAAATRPRPRSPVRPSGRGSRAPRGRRAPRPTRRRRAAPARPRRRRPRSRCRDRATRAARCRAAAQRRTAPRSRTGATRRGRAAHPTRTSGRRGSSSALGCADVASSSAARAAALSGTVSRSRSCRSRRAPSMLTPREARRVTSCRSPSFVMRLFLPVAGHPAASLHGAVPRWSIQKCASRTLAGRMSQP